MTRVEFRQDAVDLGHCDGYGRFDTQIPEYVPLAPSIEEIQRMREAVALERERLQLRQRRLDLITEEAERMLAIERERIELKRERLALEEARNARTREWNLAVDGLRPPRQPSLPTSPAPASLAPAEISSSPPRLQLPSKAAGEIGLDAKGTGAQCSMKLTANDQRASLGDCTARRSPGPAKRGRAEGRGESGSGARSASWHVESARCIAPDHPALSAAAAAIHDRPASLMAGGWECLDLLSGGAIDPPNVSPADVYSRTRAITLLDAPEAERLLALAPHLGTMAKLEQLTLVRCALGDAGAIALADALSSGSSAHVLRELDVSACGIGNSGAVALATALRGATSLRRCIVRDNVFGAEGSMALSAYLPQHVHVIR